MGGGRVRSTDFNYATEIGKLKALKYRPPFAVKLVSPTPDKPELEFTKGQGKQVTLKNDYLMTYIVDAKLEITGVVVGASELTLPPNGTFPFSIEPHDQWFDLPAPLDEKRATVPSC